MASGSKADWISLFEAFERISRRLDPTAVTASQKAIIQLERALREGKLVAKCDFAEAPVGWEPNRSFQMPMGPAERRDVPAPRWAEAEIYRRGSMLCDHLGDRTDVYGRICVRLADVDKLWSVRRHEKNVSENELFEFVKARAELVHFPPAMTALRHEAKVHFPGRNVPRALFRAVHIAVFGKSLPGPRKKSAD